MAGLFQTTFTDVPTLLLTIPQFVFSNFNLVIFYAALDVGLAFVLGLIPRFGRADSLTDMIVQGLVNGVADLAKIGGFDIAKAALTVSPVS